MKNPITSRPGSIRIGRFVLATGLLLLSLTLFGDGPILTVKGLVVDTGLTVNISQGLSIDSGRAVFMNGTNCICPQNKVFVYDINSGSSTSFVGPNGSGASFEPTIYGNKVLLVGNITGYYTNTTLSYCLLPQASPVQPCGPWHLISKTPPFNSLNFWGFPVIHGDLVAWITYHGIVYWRFSSNQTETVSVGSSAQPVGLSTNGEIISFVLTTTSQNSGTLEYFDTTNEAAGVVNPGITAGVPTGGYIPATSISQYTIAFNDGTVSGFRLRYYDYLRGQASTAGTGPIGNLTEVQNTGPAISGDRIVFEASEKALNFDCNNDGTISGAEQCLEIWNIRAPSYVATTLVAKAAPPLGGGNGAFGIYGGTIVFRGTSGTLQYVTVPMQGDVNQDGSVDSTDKSDVSSCMGQVLKGTVC